MATVYLFPGADLTEAASGVTRRRTASPPPAARRSVGSQQVRRSVGSQQVRRSVGSRQVRPGSRSAARPPLRLTRRGRIVVRAIAGIVLSIIVMGVVLLADRPARAGNGGRPVSVRHHMVLPGETLIEIAADEVPGVDPRDTVARIVELNALSGSSVRAGQLIALPVGT